MPPLAANGVPQHRSLPRALSVNFEFFIDPVNYWAFYDFSRLFSKLDSIASISIAGLLRSVTSRRVRRFCTFRKLIVYLLRGCHSPVEFSLDWWIHEYAVILWIFRTLILFTLYDNRRKMYVWKERWKWRSKDNRYKFLRGVVHSEAMCQHSKTCANTRLFVARGGSIEPRIMYFACSLRCRSSWLSNCSGPTFLKYSKW